MIDKGVPEVCLFQLNGIKNISVQLWHATSNILIQKSTVCEGCSISSRPKVEADVLFNYLARVQIYLLAEYTASLKL